MGRHSGIPYLFDHCKTVNISKLKAWGYLHLFTCKSGTINWSRNGEQTDNIGILINIGESLGSLSFDYTYDNEPVKYDVQIISKQANIGQGLLWFFVCPKTGKHCRILHLSGKYFIHRTALKGYLYETQTYSSNTRHLLKTPMYLEVKADGIYDQIYKKHFKKYYKGKPTKRYLSLLKKIGERPEASINRLI